MAATRRSDHQTVLYLGKHPVTQAQWESLTGTNPSFFSSLRGGSREVSGRSTTDFPVESINWNDVQKFVRKLNQQPSETAGVYRLPTEAEWEYACRAGTTTRYYYGDDTLLDSYGDRAERLGEYAWYQGNIRLRTHAVGQKKPNAWGLHDMLGNISEFCADWYDSDYYVNSSLEDPTGPTSGWGHVLRGGGWDSTAWECRPADPRALRVDV